MLLKNVTFITVTKKHFKTAWKIQVQLQKYSDPIVLVIIYLQPKGRRKKIQKRTSKHTFIKKYLEGKYSRQGGWFSQEVCNYDYELRKYRRNLVDVYTRSRRKNK